ncbi:MAG: ABC transporter ATP-binding protein [Thermaerobacter sp.]|nr:ABC transporter ATP-binding protein [Thermaerobacter sp.]
MAHEPLIRTTSLTVRFRRRGQSPLLAARDISLSIGSQETVALVGESGSGKTTVGRALAGMVKPSSGTIHFRNRDVSHIRGRALLEYHQDSQMIFQDPFASLNPWHTVSHHILRPLARLAHLTGNDRRQAADELLAAVGLTPVSVYRDKYPHELSGGQRQRVAIARALAPRPSFIVADEPVSMLDVSLRAGILRLLESLQDQHGLSYLYITHDLASARYLGHRIAVLYGGSLVELAPAEEIVESPRHPYTRLLLAATPGRNPTGALPETQPGAPDLSENRAGCPFAPRCPEVLPICRESRPNLQEFASGHLASCHRMSP